MDLFTIKRAVIFVWVLEEVRTVFGSLTFNHFGIVSAPEVETTSPTRAPARSSYPMACCLNDDCWYMKGEIMGKEAARKYIRNFARTLMGQLKVTEGEVGINRYHYDLISVGIRNKLVERVFQDLRHLKTETVARLATCGTMGTASGQQTSPAYERLQQGLEACTMSFVHHWDEKWIEKKKDEGPSAVMRYMAATAVVAAMYDLVVQSDKAPA